MTRSFPLVPALRRLPSVAALAALIYLALANSGPSQTGDIGSYSYFRLAFFALTGTGALYLLVALLRPRLQRWNNFALYGLLTNLILIEVAFRLFPSLVPVEVIPFLPRDAREQVAAQRGIPTAASYRGDGMLYSHAPHSVVVTANPWIRIDPDGYRNAAAVQSADVVILGDSVMFSMEARRDLAELFGQRGISGYNLAMGGYSPFHYRDVYRKYVVDRRLPHRAVLIGLVPANDIQESLKYTLVQNQNGDFRDFLGNPGGAEAVGAAWLERQPFWTVTLTMRLPALIKDRLSTLRTAMAASLPGSGLQLSLPHGTWTVPASLFDYPTVGPQTGEWAAFTTAMDELVADIVKQGAKPIIALLPSPGLLLGRHVRGGERYKATLDQSSSAIRNALTERYQPRGAQIVDLAVPMAEAVAARSLLVSPLDYHYNTEGIETLATVLLPLLPERN